MKKNDNIKTLIIFIVLIVLILGIFIFNMYKNKKLKNIDRKVEYIFDNLKYDDVYSKSSELFTQAINLLNGQNVFEYEKDINGKVKLYAINNYNKYRKIQNFNIVSNTLTKVEIDNYMEYKKIIKYANNYYIENYSEKVNNNYVGSIIDIDSYDNSFVYFKSINFYCDNSKYLGVLDNIPNCNYTSNETKFTIALENNNLRINNLEEIKNIIK